MKGAFAIRLVDSGELYRIECKQVVWIATFRNRTEAQSWASDEIKEPFEVIETQKDVAREECILLGQIV